MASTHPRMLVAEYDRRLMLYMALSAMGIVVMIIAALGEFIFHWWNHLGLWLAVGGLGATLLFGIIAASRFQVRELGNEIRAVGRGVKEVQRNTAAIPDIQRNTAAIPRIEGSSQRIEANTSETVVLLREIRDRLPPR